jgi:Na+-transporting NADH:ubiquinone oxidoreductase subunit NqrC
VALEDRASEPDLQVGVTTQIAFNAAVTERHVPHQFDEIDAMEGATLTAEGASEAFAEPDNN